MYSLLPSSTHCIFFWKNLASFMLYKNVCACRPNNRCACCWDVEWRMLVMTRCSGCTAAGRALALSCCFLPPGAQYVPFQVHCEPRTLRSLLPPEGCLALKEWVRCSGSAAGSGLWQRALGMFMLPRSQYGTRDALWGFRVLFSCRACTGSRGSAFGTLRSVISRGHFVF